MVIEDWNVLQEGVRQACALTKTLKLDDALPKNIQELITDVPDNIDNLLKRYINKNITMFHIISLVTVFEIYN